MTTSHCIEDACIVEGSIAVSACAASPQCSAGVAAIGAGIVYYGSKLVGNIVQNSASDTNSGPILPPSVGPGPYAGDSVPAGPGPKIGRDKGGQQDQVNDIGNDTGCHTCGTMDPGTSSGNWVGDHQPPTALNPDGNPQVYYPQCLSCSRSQGGRVNQIKQGNRSSMDMLDDSFSSSGAFLK